MLLYKKVNPFRSTPTVYLCKKEFFNLENNTANVSKPSGISKVNIVQTNGEINTLHAKYNNNRTNTAKSLGNNVFLKIEVKKNI